MGKEKHWRGNSKSRIVGIVPGADQGMLQKHGYTTSIRKSIRTTSQQRLL